MTVRKSVGVALALSVAPFALAQEPQVEIPEWALPQSATHTQVSPPTDFHRDAVTTMEPIGIFEG